MTRLSTHFAAIIDGLVGALGVRAGEKRALAPLFLLLWGRLRRMVRRFDAIVARAGAGKRAARPQSPGQPSPRRPGRPRDAMPRGFAWLIRLVPYTAACYGSQLQHLLTDPDMAALIAAEPGIGRILRPLCQMLGIPPGPEWATPRPARRSTDKTPPAGEKPEDRLAPEPREAAIGQLLGICPKPA